MKKQKLPAVVVLLVMTVVTVICWIVFDVYWALSNKPSPVVSEEVLRPLNPVLDENALTSLQSREELPEDTIPEVAPSPTP